MQKNTQQYLITGENELDEISFSLSPGERIFFTGDLGAGKSTFIRHIIRKHTGNPDLVVRSPTYTYYQRYDNIYHCDLYRLEDSSTWESIGGREIAEDPESILLIEWPEILDESIKPTKKVSIRLMEDGRRQIVVEVCD